MSYARDQISTISGSASRRSRAGWFGKPAASRLASRQGTPSDYRLLTRNQWPKPTFSFGVAAVSTGRDRHRGHIGFSGFSTWGNEAPGEHPTCPAAISSNDNRIFRCGADTSAAKSS